MISNIEGISNFGRKKTSDKTEYFCKKIVASKKMHLILFVLLSAELALLSSSARELQKKRDQE